MSVSETQMQIWHYWRQVHGIILTCAWFGFQNVGLWALHFKAYKYALFVHIFCMSCTTFLMALGPIIQIVLHGNSIITADIFHELWAFILYCILPILVCSGAFCKIAKDRPEVRAKIVFYFTVWHSVMGWGFIILIKVPLLTGWYFNQDLWKIMFGVIIPVSLVSYSLYLYLKFFGQKIEAVSVIPKWPTNSLRKIQSQKQLKIYSQNYFIFANYIFDINQILGSHPGGWKIIKQIRTREVDRFLYGVDPIQLLDFDRRASHTIDSINLAGEPVAILNIPSTYPKMEYLNKAKIHSASCHDTFMRIHTVYFQLQGGYAYRGYTSLSQIGQYYAVTFQQKTRLYTAVNFLQPQNLKLMVSIFGKNANLTRKSVILHHKAKAENETMIQEELISESVSANQNVLPLLIKKYDDGRFTSQFLNENAKASSIILISQPRGLGLSLNTVTSKHVVLFAGGTGLFPFSDLIDLLFKTKISEQHPQNNSIFANDPLIREKSLKKFTFKLFLAVNELSELHPITLSQINELSTSDSFKCEVKVKNANMNEFKESYANVSFRTDRFESAVAEELKKDENCAFFVCGPVRFTSAIITQVRRLNVSPQNYKIV